MLGNLLQKRGRKDIIMKTQLHTRIIQYRISKYTSLLSCKHYKLKTKLIQVIHKQFVLVVSLL